MKKRNPNTSKTCRAHGKTWTAKQYCTNYTISLKESEFRNVKYV